MRKAILALSILAIVLITSCKKELAAYIPEVPNTWTFKGKSYTAVACLFTQFRSAPQFNGNYGLAASTTQSNTDSNSAFISVIFADTSAVSAGTYTVVADDGVHPPAGSQVMIHFRIGPAGNNVLYYANGGTGAAQTVSAFITNDGKLSVNGSGITLQNQTSGSASDTARINLSLTSQ